MASKLIQLDDGTLVEIDVPGEQVEQVSGGFSDKVEASISRIQPLLVNVCKPIVSAWNEINESITVEEAEVEIGLSFEAEG